MFTTATVPAIGQTAPSREARDLLIALAKARKAQDQALAQFTTTVKPQLDARNKELKTTDREIEAHNAETARLKKEYGASCNATYADPATFDRWKKRCAELARTMSRRGKELNDRKKRLLADRQALLAKRDMLKLAHGAAKSGAETAVAKLRTMQLPGACQPCQRMTEGEKAAACYLQCWKP